MAEVMKLKGLVAYQNGAIVSRTLIGREQGTVTAFAFDEDQGLSPHTAPFDALVIVVEGEVEINIAGTNHRLKEGEIVIMPANKPHALKAITKFKMILVMIRAEP
jgi:quercetin dioxygenase-like cupin family protein